MSQFYANNRVLYFVDAKSPKTSLQFPFCCLRISWKHRTLGILPLSNITTCYHFSCLSSSINIIVTMVDINGDASLIVVFLLKNYCQLRKSLYGYPMHLPFTNAPHSYQPYPYTALPFPDNCVNSWVV